MPTLSPGVTTSAIWTPLTQKWIICPYLDRQKSKRIILTICRANRHCDPTPEIPKTFRFTIRKKICYCKKMKPGLLLGIPDVSL